MDHVMFYGEPVVDAKEQWRMELISEELMWNYEAVPMMVSGSVYADKSGNNIKIESISLLKTISKDLFVIYFWP